MKGGKQPLGYTIVEVLIVLAVSGMMFVIAAQFINGKQESTTFQQGVNELVSRIQGVISDVNDGHFSDVPISCTSNGSSLVITEGIGDQGKNYPCVFMGKMLHFKVSSAAYEVFSLAGTRESTTGGAVTKLDDAVITVIEPLTVQSTIPQQLEVLSMHVTDDSGIVNKDKGTFGFIQSVGVPDSNGGGNYATGAQSIRAAYVRTIASGVPVPLPSAQILANTNGKVDYAKGVSICVSDGARYARITIGLTSHTNSGSQLNIDRKIVSTEPLCTQS